MLIKILTIISCVCATGICAFVIISICELVKWLSEARFQRKYPKYTLALKEYQYALHRVQSYRNNILNPLYANIDKIGQMSTDIFTENSKQTLLKAYTEQKNYALEVYRQLLKEKDKALDRVLDLRKIYGKRA